jgi:hypothetical protein
MFMLFHQEMIGSVAKKVNMLNSYVVWSQVALEAAKAERKSPGVNLIKLFTAVIYDCS